ncbi:MAG: hypothetical protein HYT21_02025 [Candidatus Nealsonbacteria bacterium]|nr:hypothetical protein [Candidatus Nealsonbacteria bacterium]
MSDTATPNAFSPDFLLFAFPLAAFLDVFGFISIFISFGILGFIVSLLLGIPLVIWMVTKENDIAAAKERVRELRKPGAGATKAEGKVAKKVLGKGLRKLILGSVLVFFPYWTWSALSVLRKG